MAKPMNATSKWCTAAVLIIMLFYSQAVFTDAYTPSVTRHFQRVLPDYAAVASTVTSRTLPLAELQEYFGYLTAGLAVMLLLPPTRIPAMYVAAALFGLQGYQGFLSEGYKLPFLLLVGVALAGAE